MDSLCKACTRRAVAAVAHAQGYTHGDSDAVDVLASLLQAHLAEMLAYIHTVIEASNRTSANIKDAQLLLDTYKVSADDLRELLAASVAASSSSSTATPTGAVTDALDPDFSTAVPLIDAADVLPLPAHIPKWMPSFPPVHAYKRTQVVTSHASHAAVYPLAAEQSRLVDATLRRLMVQHRELFNDVPTYALRNLSRTVRVTSAGEVDKWWRRAPEEAAVLTSRNGLQKLHFVYSHAETEAEDKALDREEGGVIILDGAGDEVPPQPQPARISFTLPPLPSTSSPSTEPPLPNGPAIKLRLNLGNVRKG
ncbi:hypothetical protein RI367_006487 [Sorochytrium milnesiophthora]